MVTKIKIIVNLKKAKQKKKINKERIATSQINNGALVKRILKKCCSKRRYKYNKLFV
jgi:hypothetical protein